VSNWPALILVVTVLLVLALAGQLLANDGGEAGRDGRQLSGSGHHRSHRHRPAVVILSGATLLLGYRSGSSGFSVERRRVVGAAVRGR
jgi:hypothetical protein